MAAVVIAGITLTGIFFFCMVQAGKRADKQMEKPLEIEKSKKMFQSGRNFKLRFAMLRMRGGECHEKSKRMV